ncbi:MAG: SDR family oxidoreductase [Gemmatimonadales bacterium]|jgi:NAD(P)-dependent dehydrogenase (short-subunit alcohol dehydrogenase family)
MRSGKGSSLFPPDLFAGRLACVTGGGTGIGAGITRALARHGADIVLASRRLAHLEPMVSEVERLGREALACQLDVRDREACDAVVAQALDRFGRIDLLVNNAAGNFLVRAAELSEKGWRAVVDIVLTGTFNMSQAVYPALRDAGGGSIVNITTTYVGSGAPFMAHSGAAKAGVLNLTRTLAVEWGGDGIRVNAVAPGLVEDTEGARRLAESIGIVDAYRERVPLGRLVTIDDVAVTVLFLASDAASLITGVEITVDGGASLGGGFKGVADALDQIP